MDINNLVDSCMSAISSKINNLNTLNVVIVGKTGVGKSTLINAIFRENLATTGIGEPVTKRMQMCTKPGIPLRIYDTKGFELGKEAQDEVREELLEKIKEGVDSRDINKAIHCIWYCVNVQSSRFEEEEIQWIQEFTKHNQIYHVPVIIVLTQAFSKKKAQELKKKIESKNLDVIQVLPVLAQDYDDFDDDYVIRAYGTDTLVEIMQDALSDELSDTLMYVQQASLKAKKKKAQATVAAAAISAAAAGATPIPFSDAAILIPIEVTMMASITVVFGFDFSKSILTSLVSTIIGTGGTTIAGKTIVSNLLKLIPGIGSIVGGVISAGTASLLTTALGEAYIGIMIAIYNGEIKENELETSEGKNRLSRMFKEQMKKANQEK